MKNGLLVFLFCVAISPCFSQEKQNKDDDIKEVEFAFNSTPLIANLIPFDNTFFLNSSDFMLIYKKRKSENRFQRVAIALNVRSQINSNRTTKFLFKLGSEFKAPIVKSWVAHYGGEVFLGANSNLDVVELNTEFGAAAIYGIQWKMNHRIALGTEGYFTLGVGENEGTIEAFLEFRLPKSFLLSIYF